MASEMKVEVVHKEIIKPSSPTPHHLRNLGLSVFDQFQPEIYIPVILFYRRSGDEVNNNRHCLFAEKLKLLKKSLSEALTRFYPFAGKFEYNVSISCNDHGAAFLEAQVNCPISKILDKPEFSILDQLLPTAIGSNQSEAGYLLLVQASLFECGGLAIGVRICHKVADASTFSAFIRHWTEISLGSAISRDHDVHPAEFSVAASLFPPQDFFNSPKPTVHLPKDKCVTRRYVFDASNIAALKTKAASATVPKPTRVEAVSALIWKCAMEASRWNLGSIRPSVLCQAVNIRKGLSGQAENLMGNLVWCFTAMNLESELDYKNLVVKLRKGIEVYKEEHPNGVSGDVVMQTIKESGNLGRHDVETYAFSSWCRLPFYKANFGWGKPAWVSIRTIEFKNMIALMDTNDGGGIEATLTLKEDDMAMIGSNKEFLAYASLNPAVI
ncbi:BAHD acyltransferase At5g47980-like [Malus domestica]|uniref:BAHD acyltransferase At5g47980-like n=2 Tax=Malus TaxID=3749 RepID=UPI0010AA3B90|nr:BAHD acyltransferase At5g47980-like [Malus domestica]